MKLVNNKYVLYFVALLALIINLGNLTLKKFDLVILFAIASLITYYYTKNMIIVLSSGILIIVLYKIFMAFFNKEGFKEGATPPAKKKNKSTAERHATPSKKGFENKKLNPKLIDTIPSKKKILDQVGNVDKIEKAYDSLDSALGENSIRSINGATSELIKEQKEMLGQIKDITPTLEKALQNVSKIDLDKVLNTFSSMNKSMGTS